MLDETRYSRQEIAIHSKLIGRYAERVLLHEGPRRILHEMDRDDLREKERLIHSLGKS